MVTQRGSIDEAVELVCARFIRLFVSALRLSSGAPANPLVCTENLMRVDDAMESPKLAE